MTKTKWNSKYDLTAEQEMILDMFSYDEIKDMASGYNMDKYIEKFLEEKHWFIDYAAHFFEDLIVKTAKCAADSMGTKFSDELKAIFPDDIEKVIDYHSAILKAALDILSNDVMDLISWDELEMET